MHENVGSTPHLPPNAGLMVKSWSSTLSRCSVFILRDLVTSGGFFARELEEEEDSLSEERNTDHLTQSAGTAGDKN